jgi:hypothetical protein
MTHDDARMPGAGVNLKHDGPNGKRIYKLGGVAALLTVAVAFGEIAITFLPGGYASPETAVNWFEQLQSNSFMGLRNLGLLNIFMLALGIPLYFSLFIAHWKTDRGFAALAMILSFMGTAIFFATNRAFPMLELSGQYAEAASDAQRSAIEAAGRAMLSVGRSHSPGTFLAFFLGETAGIMISAVMLRSGVFGKATAVAGILGFSLLLVHEVFASFLPSFGGTAMVVAMGGGTLNVVWLVLVGLRFVWLAREEA